MSAPAPDPHAARRCEVAALSVAMLKQQQRIDQTRSLLAHQERRLAAQEAELRFQKLILRIPYAS